jgi:hypothetical protein
MTMVMAGEEASGAYCVVGHNIHIRALVAYNGFVGLLITVRKMVTDVSA